MFNRLRFTESKFTQPTFNQLHKHLLATGLAVGLAFTSVSALPVAAADDPGTSPGVALAPTQDWSMLEAGQSRWYTFKYNATSSTGDDSLNQALVEVETSVEDSVRFEVWPSQSLQFRYDADEYEPVGRGSKMVDDEYTLVWAGSSTASDTYYILVENQRNEPSYYELTIGGEGVSIPESAVAEMSVAETSVAETSVAEMSVVEDAATEELLVEEAPSMQVMTEEAAASMTEAVDTGTSAARAVAPSEEWMTLDPGQSYWYEFKFDYDEGDAQTARTSALIELDMEQAGSVRFEVWTPEQLHKWQNGEEFDPMGAGSVLLEGTDAADDASLIWTGSDQSSGTYYVIVENDSSNTVMYDISITGSGVSF